jgi:hypothetical protein
VGLGFVVIGEEFGNTPSVACWCRDRQGVRNLRERFFLLPAIGDELFGGRPISDTPADA